LEITSFINLELIFLTPPPEAPNPAAHRAHIIFQPFQGKVLVPEIFGLVNRFQ